jgi:hypothetical protein
MDPDEADRVGDEICAVIPALWTLGNADPSSDHNNDAGWILPQDPNQLRLFRLVRRKQMHRCTAPNQPGCRCNGTCQYKFPMACHLARASSFNPTSHRHEYFRPRHVDRNVVPYHPVSCAPWQGTGGWRDKGHRTEGRNASAVVLLHAWVLPLL